jgi:uncharacterized protein (DUF1778 family)
MARKSEYLQIRLSPREKAALRRRAAQAGQDLSSYVVTRLLPSEQRRFEEILVALRAEENHAYAYAELNDLLSGLPSGRLREVVADADLQALTDLTRNYVAAMVEEACRLQGAEAPDWTRGVLPLSEPFFATGLLGLRLHLLKSSPVAFKRRNLFVDSTVGDRV